MSQRPFVLVTVRVWVRIALLITIAVCAFVVLMCLFADFSSAGDSFFATYRSLDILMVLVCVASMVIPVLAAIGVAREKLERVSIWLTAVPFTFFGLFVMIEFWGEIEPASYVAGAFSTLAVVCAFVLSFLAAPREAPAAAPSTPSLPHGRPPHRLARSRADLSLATPAGRLVSRSERRPQPALLGRARWTAQTS